MIRFIAAISCTIATIITFGIAITTLPLSGPFCAGGCFSYPYLNIAERYPADYVWMYAALVWLVLYVALITSIKTYTPRHSKIFADLGWSFGIIAAATLLINYFVQLTVIQPSILASEADGISFFSQFNPHGIFIALEELGFVLISIASLCIAPVFTGGKLQTAIRWTLASSCVLTITAFAIIATLFGVGREYRFEVVAIGIQFTAVIIGGLLMSIVFWRERSTSEFNSPI